MIKFSQRISATSTATRTTPITMGGSVGRNPITSPKILQGALATLPPIHGSKLLKILNRMINLRYGIAIEWTTDPHPRNLYWNLWCSPLFPYKPHQDSFKRDETITAESAIGEVTQCVVALGGTNANINKTEHAYVKLSFFDPSRGVESTVLSFIIARPEKEQSYYLGRTEGPGRKISYSFIPSEARF